MLTRSLLAQIIEDYTDDQEFDEEITVDEVNIIFPGALEALKADIHRPNSAVFLTFQNAVPEYYLEPKTWGTSTFEEILDKIPLGFVVAASGNLRVEIISEFQILEWNSEKKEWIRLSETSLLTF